VEETYKQVAIPNVYRVYGDGGGVIQYNPVNTAGIDNGIVIKNTTNSSGGSGYDYTPSYDSGSSYYSGTDYSSYSSADAVRQAAYDNIDYGSVDATDYYAYE
jgi:hypothetical protein